MWYARSAASGRSHATSTFIDNCEAVKNPYLKKNDGAGCLYPLFSESSRVSNTGGLLSERAPSDVCGLTCFRAAVARPHKQVYHRSLKEARRAVHNLYYLLANKPATDGYVGVLHHFPLGVRSSVVTVMSVSVMVHLVFTPRTLGTAPGT